MTTRKFAVGDRVQGVLGLPRGQRGVVRHVDGDDLPYAVEFDDADFPGHNCRGILKGSNGFWCGDADLLLLESEDRAWKDTNPKDRAATTRVDLSLFPDTALIHGALAMTEGDYKYGAYNFRTIGVQASVYVAAARRHIMKYWNGETYDERTRIHHLGSALACLAVLLDADACGQLNDDRPPKAPVAAMLYSEEKTVQKLQELFPNKPKRYTEAGNE